FDDAYEGVCSLRNIRKSKQEDELTPNEIETNLRSLKTNLASSEAPYAQHFRKYLKKKKNTSNLSWEVPLASQVICADSEMVKLLEEKDVEAYNFFMDPAERMKVATPPVIKNKCDEFVINFMDSITDIPDNRFSHDKSWKESDENLAKITTDILEILRDVWKNPAFGQKLAKSQSEGTYMTDVIVPLIRASLKDLPIGKSGYISTAERQSMASKDRRGVGKRPDLMFIASCNNRTYELIFAESSRIVCDKQKKNDDEVKLWREMNDGMYWAHKGCKSDKDNFGIIGIQVRGTEMRLNTLVRGVDEIDRLYNLFTVEIPIQPTDEDIVFRFVEALLTLRNILHVNISLLFYASPVSSSSNSSTVSSPRREGEQIRTRK
ncbi:11499_t:CDS:2, partial [Gigaspora margarita]